MELLQLRYFVKVAETENITKAAEQLYVSQPALSVTIARLERDLSITLFRRSANRISLTPAGEEFLKYAKAALDMLDRGMIAAKNIGDYKKKDIHIVSALGVVRTVKKTYSKNKPQINVNLGFFRNKEIKKALVNGKADFGVSLGLVEDQRLENRLVMEGRVCVAIGTGNPKFKGRDSVSIRELAGEPLFCSRLAETEQLTRKMFSARSLPCNVISLDEKDVLFEAARKNLGLVVCVPMLYEYLDGNILTFDTIRFMLIDDVTDCWRIYLTYRKGVCFEPQVQELYDMTREYFEKNNEFLRKFLEK